MVDAQRFPYKIIDSSLGMVDRMPYLPLVLSLDGRSLNTVYWIQAQALMFCPMSWVYNWA
jgi:hypothetical protein